MSIYFEDEDEEEKPKKKRRRIPAWLADELREGKKESFDVEWIEELKRKPAASWDYVDFARLAEWVLENTSASDRIVEGLSKKFEDSSLGNREGALARRKAIQDLIGYYDFERGMRNKSYSLDQRFKY